MFLRVLLCNVCFCACVDERDVGENGDTQHLSRLTFSLFFKAMCCGTHTYIVLTCKME
jgi:hypothetical protein